MNDRDICSQVASRFMSASVGGHDLKAFDKEASTMPVIIQLIENKCDALANGLTNSARQLCGPGSKCEARVRAVDLKLDRT